MLLQHIDTLSDISDAFSSFVSMPPQKKERTDLNAIIRHAIAIFDLPYIRFESKQEQICLWVDKNQMNRMLTNLLKNAIYATDNIPDPLIEVTTYVIGDFAYIVVKDNGSGIPPELQLNTTNLNTNGKKKFFKELSICGIRVSPTSLCSTSTSLRVFRS